MPGLPGPQFAPLDPAKEDVGRDRQLDEKTHQEDDENRRLEPVGDAHCRVGDLGLIAPVSQLCGGEVFVADRHDMSGRRGGGRKDGENEKK